MKIWKQSIPTASYVKIIPTRWGNMACLTCDDYMRIALELYGESCQVEIDVCLYFIKPGDCVIDAGACIGTFALPFALRVGSAGQVIAFEPQRLPYMALVTNLFLNSVGEWCRPVRAALGATSGMAKVHRLDPRSSNSNVGGARLNDEANVSKLKSLGLEDIGVMTIDDLKLNRLDFLKVDTEGMDSQVIAGGKESIAQFKPVILAEAQSSDKEELDKLRSVLKSLNYRAYEINPSLFNPQNVRMETENIFGGMVSENVLAFPRDIPTPDFLTKAPLFVE